MLKLKMHDLKWRNDVSLGKILTEALSLSSPQGLFQIILNEGKQ